MKDASLTEQKNVQHYSQYYFSFRNMERCFHKINAKPTAFIPCYNCKSYYALLKRTKKISYFYGVNIGLLFSVYCPNYMTGKGKSYFYWICHWKQNYMLQHLQKQYVLNKLQQAELLVSVFYSIVNIMELAYIF